MHAAYSSVSSSRLSNTKFPLWSCSRWKISHRMLSTLRLNTNNDDDIPQPQSQVWRNSTSEWWGCVWCGALDLAIHVVSLEPWHEISKSGQLACIIPKTARRPQIWESHSQTQHQDTNDAISSVCATVTHMAHFGLFASVSTDAPWTSNVCGFSGAAIRNLTLNPDSRPPRFNQRPFADCWPSGHAYTAQNISLFHAGTWIECGAVSDKGKPDPRYHPSNLLGW
ncbi:hypothetical protein B0H66DRAFT_594240 [Apodospora peruviana]|uniref:Uncharacterized protein n=1 Tax=Apodospora peruviana TaxID=516989 RepID=A0AAE0M064_9PEZI|nr:hypothetical protein B0H66DRAFT_594240 [Apodospora peruviana]